MSILTMLIAIHVNRTDRGLAKERLRDYWEELVN